MNTKTVKPITIFQSSWYFIISSLLIYSGLYILIPRLLDKGIPFIVGYFITLYIPLALLFFTALILYKLEGNAWNISNFKNRMQLKPLKKADCLWIVGIIIIYFIIMLIGTPAMNKLAQTPFFAPPDFFPAEINPNKTSIAGYMMDYKLFGKYWAIIAYFSGWFFNIFGEELLWRGIILPRQIMKYGSKAWVIHGLMWGLWHFYWKWQLITLIPFALLFSYVAYKRKNTWIGIISHGTLNAIPLIIGIVYVLNEVTL